MKLCMTVGPYNLDADDLQESATLFDMGFLIWRFPEIGVPLEIILIFMGFSITNQLAIGDPTLPDAARGP